MCALHDDAFLCQYDVPKSASGLHRNMTSNRHIDVQCVPEVASQAEMRFAGQLGKGPNLHLGGKMAGQPSG